MRTSIVAMFVLSIALTCGYTSPAHARAQYLAAFKKAYPNLEAAASETKCMMCHPNKDSKKERNEYAKEMGKSLTAKNEKDDTKLKEALTKAEAGKSAIEGKTFGDLIKADKLPSATE
ncbi:DUF4485 domain-containing protein [Lacunimicrobium album]